MARPRRIWNIILVFLGLFLIFLLLDFFYHRFHLGIPCLFHAFTGLYCPGCGVFRAASALFHLDFALALRHNFLVFLLLPFLVYCLVRAVLDYLREIPPRTGHLELVLGLGFVGLSLIFGVLRNLPAFSFLAPPG